MKKIFYIFGCVLSMSAITIDEALSTLNIRKWATMMNKCQSPQECNELQDKYPEFFTPVIDIYGEKCSFYECYNDLKVNIKPLMDKTVLYYTESLSISYAKLKDNDEKPLAFFNALLSELQALSDEDKTNLAVWKELAVKYSEIVFKCSDDRDNSFLFNLFKESMNVIKSDEPNIQYALHDQIIRMVKTYIEYRTIYDINV